MLDILFAGIITLLMEHPNQTINRHVGHKIRERRSKLHLSQADLAHILGVSAQQVQRYEAGENAISLERLLQIANVLNVSSNYFLNDLPEDNAIGQEISCHIVARGLRRPLRILLVEDDPNDVILFQQALTHSSLAPHFYHLGKSDKVIDYLQYHDEKYHQPYPDIIILDINMPRINGIDVLKKIKSSAHKKLPVIILTNSVRTKDMIACYELQASGFIQKSVDLHQYFGDVARIINYWSEMAILPNAA